MQVPPSLSSRLFPSSASGRRRHAVASATTATLLLAPLAAGGLLALFDVSPSYAAAGAPRRGKQEGDILKVFDNGRVYIVTNDDPALAEILLRGAAPKERRVLTPEEWAALPDGTRDYVSVVYLINREKLPLIARVPEACNPAPSEVWSQIVRRGRTWGIAYDVTLSAPDGAWLRRAITDFRRLKEPPRRPDAQKRTVESLAVITVGPGAARAAEPLLKASAAVPSGGLLTERLPHLVVGDVVTSRIDRLAEMDEIVLIDRGTAAGGAQAAPMPEPLATLTAARRVGVNDTVAWREPKENGKVRVIVSAPTAGMLAEALRRHPDPFTIPQGETVIATARDLRQVRRIAVAGVQGGAGGKELARQLASRVATEVRALDTFEVLERAGLNEMLGEVALGQAGITRAKDRLRVQTLAAADALLIVEVTGVSGRTEYKATHERLTPKLSGPPRKPLGPSRLRYDIAIPGKEEDPIARALTEAVLKRVVGTKSSREYRDAQRVYDEETVPAYEQRRAEYEEHARTRPVEWKQSLVARSGVIVSGSLRLVDLKDGLVLWEQSFSGSEREEAPAGSRTVTTSGDESHPGEPECPAPTDEVSDMLRQRAAEEGVSQAVAALQTTALLPDPVSAVMTVAADGTDAPTLAPANTATAATSGRILDIDGGSLLIGLGATDGLAVGDSLVVQLPGGETATLKITRVRPRTCDATFMPTTTAATRAKVTVGMDASRGPVPTTATSVAPAESSTGQ